MIFFLEFPFLIRRLRVLRKNCLYTANDFEIYTNIINDFRNILLKIL